MALLPVDEALSRILAGAHPRAPETVPLAEAGGRILAEDVIALRDQPPFDASAMDGYAVRASDIASPPASLRVTGEAAAGRRFGGEVGPGEAVRIFTGAPVPPGADTILIQENARRIDATTIEALDATAAGRHIRRAGLDFATGRRVLEAGRELDAAALSLAASANRPALSVHGVPTIAILATGDELVAPGTPPGPDQIVSSNNVGVAEIVRRAGGRALDLGIARDREAEIGASIAGARRQGADVIVTIGGASVGDHDLVHKALSGQGMELDFWKIAMRPGKPLMFGRLGETLAIGLPGNPVSALVCAHLFLAPLVARLSGRPHHHDVRTMRLGADMAANAERQDYVRAIAGTTDGEMVATPLDLQDSSMLSALAAANALIVRPPNEPAAQKGAPCQVVMLR
ncbi:molybdopterin molybdenumtransferase MoeA [Chelativorans sp. ZYF759]|uniref:molybdopterin molybdotransferase MoeA n=1 Tax=Chelativorans sp. ZYF759 TaxID=2692213 RepID=UPI00145D783B|nr:gephyrin-like molybdotransferase Glp [Chelativorans sp. ZYF759]NMG38512.1 molybdopterin molybdenumtransferase MoeA [Chelativorans sp. ZYF759]